MNRLVECVPNFSAGRRDDVIDTLTRVVDHIPGVHLLDVHRDADHNRSVYTLVGPPGAVINAAYEMVAVAAEHIDMTRHSGVHPRIGAADVVPLIPVRGVSMAECVELAQALGQRIGQDLDLPVYLYGEAATRPDRKKLENVRRGQYEGLSEAILTDPDRQPDYGPARLGPAGAVAVGARGYLVAFNAYLDTADVSIAKYIARAIRESSGGLPNVKAMGVLVDGRAQVSMNLTNVTQTPIHRVMALIDAQALEHGVTVGETELVGLMPRAAVIATAGWHLKLGLDAGQVLEDRIEAALAAGDFIERLASSKPTPGGGAASAHSLAVAAALCEMVFALSGRKAGRDVLAGQVPTLTKLRLHGERLVSEDEEAYRGLMKAPKEHRVIALRAAAAVPVDVLESGVRLMRILAEHIEGVHPPARPDAVSAGHIAYGAIQSARVTASANLGGLPSDEAAHLRGHIETLAGEAAELLAHMEQV